MERISRKQWLGLSAVAGAGLLAVSVFWFSRTPPRVAMAKDSVAAEASPGKAVRVEVIHPAYGGVQRVVDQPGSVIAFESADLYAKISGYLQMQNVDIGSRVKQGEVLAEIFAPEFEKQVSQGKAAVDQANAQVVQAEARIDTAIAERDAATAFIKQAEAEVKRTAAFHEFREKQYKRIKELFDLKSIDERLVDEKLEEMNAAAAAEVAAEAGVLTAKAKATAAEANVSQAKADLVNAKANVEVAQAALDKAQVFVDYTRIVSPYGGVVTRRAYFRGAFIRSAEQGGLVPLLAVSRTDLMRVVVMVPDRDVPYVAVGKAATIEIDALPGEDFHGQVSRMADSEDPETRTMRVEIDLPNPHHKLREGMYGRVLIPLSEGTGTLAIPSDCLVGNIENNQASVFVVQSGKAHLEKVTVGSDSGLKIEIIKGLTPESQVISRHNGPLKEGTSVDVASAAARP